MKSLILLDDDDVEIRTFIQKALELNNFDVLDTVDGNEAIRFLQTISVELVITDIFMPNKGGIELATEIKASFPDVKIIGITGGDIKQIVSENSLDDIFHGFLQKPFGVKNLIKEVKKFID